MERRTLIKAASALLALGALGGGVLVQRRRAHERLQSDTITDFWQDLGPGIHWLLPSLRDARMVVPDRPHTMDEALSRAPIARTRSFLVNTNSQRLRNPEVGSRRALRLACVGDSVTFGWGVADAESYPAQLQAALRARGLDAEVLNAGVPAQSVRGMTAWLTRKAPALDLDGVLFTRRAQLDQPRPYAAYAQGVEEARRALPGVPFLVFLPPVSRFDPRGTLEHEEEARRLKETVKVPVLDLTAALWEGQGDRGVRLREEGDAILLVRPSTDEVLLRVLASAGAPAAPGPGPAPGPGQGPGPKPPSDLPRAIYDAFDEDPSVKEALFFDSGHPDAEGFGVFVQAVMGQLERQGWLG